VDPTLEALTVTPTALAAAALPCARAADAAGRAAHLVTALPLTSADVGAEGAALAAAAARLTRRAHDRLAGLAADLDADADRLRACAQGYVSSDTAAAHGLGGHR
jgi:hypothetical protein